MHLFLRLLLLGFACLTAPTMATELRFVTEDFPPFTYPLEGAPPGGNEEAAGPFVEIVQAVCARLQYHCRIDLLPWRRALVSAEQGEADGIFTVVRSPQREKHFHISQMLVTSRYSVFASKHGNYVFSRAEDMAGRVIAVYGPSGTSQVLSRRLQEVADVQLKMIANNRRLLRMLQTGRFGPDGLAVVNQDVAWHLIEDEQLGELREAGELEPVSYGIGLSRKAITEAQFHSFEQALAALIEDGTVPKILQHYQLEPAY